MVYVSGAVVNSGVYTLDSEDRITDALAAAGGVTSDGVLNGLNLALRVTDEAEYYVLKLGESPPVGAIGPASTTGLAGQTGGLINLNLASVAILDTLPGIGPVLAQAIVDYRENAPPSSPLQRSKRFPRSGQAPTRIFAS
jgi:competence protein ComEA